MGKANQELVIENENLFRALFSAPAAILFAVLALDSSGIAFFQFLFVLLALYFTLNALAHAAYYTNELTEGTAEPAVKNTNLAKLLYCVPLAIFFVFFAMNSISSSEHVLFNVIYVLAASYFTLSSLAYAAFYTNDSYVSDSH